MSLENDSEHRINRLQEELMSCQESFTSERSKLHSLELENRELNSKFEELTKYNISSKQNSSDSERNYLEKITVMERSNSALQDAMSTANATIELLQLQLQKKAVQEEKRQRYLQQQQLELKHSQYHYEEIEVPPESNEYSNLSSVALSPPKLSSSLTTFRSMKDSDATVTNKFAEGSVELVLGKLVGITNEIDKKMKKLGKDLNRKVDKKPKRNTNQVLVLRSQSTTLRNHIDKPNVIPFVIPNPLGKRTVKEFPVRPYLDQFELPINQQSKSHSNAGKGLKHHFSSNAYDPSLLELVQDIDPDSFRFR